METNYYHTSPADIFHFIEIERLQLQGWMFRETCSFGYIDSIIHRTQVTKFRRWGAIRGAPLLVPAWHPLNPWYGQGWQKTTNFRGNPEPQTGIYIQPQFQISSHHCPWFCFLRGGPNGVWLTIENDPKLKQDVPSWTIEYLKCSMKFKLRTHCFILSFIYCPSYSVGCFVCLRTLRLASNTSRPPKKTQYSGPRLDIPITTTSIINCSFLSQCLWQTSPSIPRPILSQIRIWGIIWGGITVNPGWDISYSECTVKRHIGQFVLLSG